jgi:hypothetical protein
MRFTKALPKGSKSKGSAKRKPTAGQTDVELIAVGMFVGEASSGDRIAKQLAPAAYLRAWQDAEPSVRVIYRARALALRRAIGERP